MSTEIKEPNLYKKLVYDIILSIKSEHELDYLIEQGLFKLTDDGSIIAYCDTDTEGLNCEE